VQSQSVGRVFSRSWTLLTNNWVLLIPGLLIGIVSGIVVTLISPGADAQTAPGVLGQLALGVLAGMIALIAQIATTAYTTGMAGGAWATGKTSLADGRRAFSRDGVNVFIAMIGLGLLGIVAVLLSPVTLFLSVLAYYLLTLYTMASAVVGERPGLRALRESFSIAIERFFPTLLIAALLGVVYVLVGVFESLISFAPFVGPIVSAVIVQCVTAYATLVIVGEYLELRASSRQVV